MDDPSTGQGQREPPAFLPPSMNPPDGPTFVLITKEAGSFKTSNPFAVKRELDNLCGPLKTAKPLRSGSLLVETDTGPQATLLMRTRVFQGSPVSVTLADRLNCVQGCIRSDSLTELSNEELLEELASQGVVRVERLRSRNVRVLGPNPTVRISFRGSVLPQAVRCGYLRVPVQPWVPAPQQCNNCWDIGTHVARACRRRTAICGRCAEAHPTEGCREGPQCANCGQPHPAWDPGCPVKQEAKRWHQAQQREARNAHRAQAQTPVRTPTSWPDLDDGEWPPLPTKRNPGHRASTAHSAADRGPGRTPDSRVDTAERAPDTGADRAPDTGADRAPDTGADRAPDTGADRAPDTGADRAPDTGADRAPGTGADRASDTGADRAPDTKADRAPNTDSPPADRVPDADSPPADSVPDSGSEVADLAPDTDAEHSYSQKSKPLQDNKGGARPKGGKAGRGTRRNAKIVQ